MKDVAPSPQKSGLWVRQACISVSMAHAVSANDRGMREQHRGRLPQTKIFCVSLMEGLFIILEFYVVKMGYF